jgi:hypothetical protein
MFPFIIAGAIGFVVAKLFEEDEAPKYAKGGSVLLAPNGKPSNLTPEQYKLVRTPAFKKWFGDWENDPANASKVVDSNGEPKVYYQGLPYYLYPNGKNIYEEDNNGIFFTSNKKNALTYGAVKSMFIKCINPKDVRNYFGYDGKKISDNLRNDKKYNYKTKEEKQYINSDLNVIKFYEDVIDKYGKSFEILDENEGKEFVFKNKEEIKKFLIPTSEKGFLFLNFKYRSAIWNWIGNYIKNSQYDGLFATDEDSLAEEINDSIVVYNSNQIKLADGTNTTFDSNNPDIRFEDGGLIDDIKDLNKYLVYKYAGFHYHYVIGDYKFEINEFNDRKGWALNTYKKYNDNWEFIDSYGYEGLTLKECKEMILQEIKQKDIRAYNYRQDEAPKYDGGGGVNQNFPIVKLEIYANNPSYNKKNFESEALFDFSNEKIKFINLDTFGDDYRFNWIKVKENSKGFYIDFEYYGGRIYIENYLNLYLFYQEKNKKKFDKGGGIELKEYPNYADDNYINLLNNFYENVKIENGSKYIGQKFMDIFPFLGRKKVPQDFRKQVNQYDGVIRRLKEDNYSTKAMKQTDLNKLEKINEYMDKKKYLSRFYLDNRGVIINFK